MKNFFGQDGFVYRAVNKFVDLVVLNVMFVLSCIPIITIGAANTSLYTLTLKMCKNQEGYIVKEYWKSFKNNFKKSTIVWCLFLVLFLVLGIDFWIFEYYNLQMKKVLQIIVCAIFIISMMLYSYVFPLIAVFENTIGHYLKNSLIIAMTRIGYTLIIVMINVIPLVLFFIGGEWLAMGMRIFVLIGWALIAYVNSFLLNKVLERYKK